MPEQRSKTFRSSYLELLCRLFEQYGYLSRSTHTVSGSHSVSVVPVCNPILRLSVSFPNALAVNFKNGRVDLDLPVCYCAITMTGMNGCSVMS